MADIQLPDGNTVRIPDYALESTQARMLKAMEAQMGADSKAFKLYQELVKDAKTHHKDTKTSTKETAQRNKKRNQTLRELLKETEENNKNVKMMMNAGRDVGSAFRLMGTVGSAAASFAISMTKVAKDAVMGFGSTLSNLAQQGVGLTDVRGSALGLIGDLQSIGLSATEASNTMGAFSSVVQTMGKDSFGAVQKQFANLTALGSEFGLTMGEMSAVLSEDLETRQKLGILQGLDAAQQASRSRELFKMQMESASILGKSIDEIRQASRAGLEDNAAVALRIQSIAQKRGQDTANEFTNMVQGFSSRLSGLGVSTDLIGQIVNESMDVVAFSSAQGKELARTLATIDGEAKTNLMGTLQNLNRMTEAGDTEGARRAMQEFENQLMQTTKVDRQSLQQLLGGMGAFGEQMALVLGQLDQAKENLEKGLDFQFPELAKSSAAFSNALNLVRGQIGQVGTMFMGVMEGPMTVFSNALTQSGENSESVFSTILSAGQRIADMFSSLFLPLSDMKDSTESLRQSMNQFIENFVTKILDKMAEFRKFMDDNNLTIGDLVQQGIEKFQTVLSVAGTVVDGISTLATAVARIVGWFMKTNDQGEIEGINWSKLVSAAILIPLGAALVKGMGRMIAARASVGIMNRLTGGGGADTDVAGSAVGSAGGGGGGKALGKGMQGAAKGFKAFGKGSVAILKGAAVVGGVIVILGAAIAGATWLMGKALPTLAEGLASFEDIDGKNLAKVGLGMAAFGTGMAAMGAGMAVGAIAGIVGSIAGGIAGFFGGKSPLEQLKEFGEIRLNVRNIKLNSEAAVAFGKAMAAMGAGGIGSAMSSLGNMTANLADGITEFFGGTLPYDRIREFARQQFDTEGIRNNSEAVAAYGKAMLSMGQGSALTALGSIVGGLAQGIRAFFGGDDELPVEEMNEFAKLQLDSRRIKNNSEAVAAYGKAMSSLGGGSAMSALGAISRVIARGIANFFSEGTDPFAQLVQFSNLNINLERTRNNAQAVTAFTDALKVLADRPGALSAINQAIGRIVEGAVSLVTGDFIKNIKEFGEVEFSENVVKNAEVVSKYGQAIGLLTKNTDQGNLRETTDQLTRLAGVYERFASLNTGRMSSSVAAIKDLNNALMLGQTSPTPDTTATQAPPTTAGTGTELEQIPSTGNADLDKLIAAMVESNRTTHRLLRDLNESVQNM